MLVKCKNPFFSFSAICQIDSRTDELVVFRLGFGDDVSVWVDDATAGNESPVVLFASLASMHAEACIGVTSRLVRQVVMEQSFLLLPLV